MKTIIAVLALSGPLSVGAFETTNVFRNNELYQSRKGYAFEKKCFRLEYREYYVPGNSISPGYVKSYNEKISIPCNNYRKVFNHYHQKTLPQNSYVKYKKYKSVPKCTGSTTLGGLIGGGIAASLSKSDAYGWTIPLGAVLGAGIGNAECK